MEEKDKDKMKLSLFTLFLIITAPIWIILEMVKDA